MVKINRIKCIECEAVLESKSVHDFVQCSCDNESFVDGGQDYQRIGGKDLSKILIWNYIIKEYTLINQGAILSDPINTEIKKDTNTDKELLDMAIQMIAEWCNAVNKSGTSWWDIYYKNVMYRSSPLRALINNKINDINNES